MTVLPLAIVVLAGPQFCGDARLSNFGAFVARERSLLFDLNDFEHALRCGRLAAVEGL